MIRLGLSRDELGVIFDQVGTPTYANDLAKAILKIVDILGKKESQKELYGLYHFSNEGVASWYDFAHEIFRIRQIPVRLNPILTKDYPTPARRPHFSVMDKSKIKSVFSLTIPHWKDSLKECMSLLE